MLVDSSATAIDSINSHFCSEPITRVKQKKAIMAKKKAKKKKK